MLSPFFLNLQLQFPRVCRGTRAPRQAQNHRSLSLSHTEPPLSLSLSLSLARARSLSLSLSNTHTHAHARAHTNTPHNQDHYTQQRERERERERESARAQVASVGVCRGGEHGKACTHGCLVVQRCCCAPRHAGQGCSFWSRLGAPLVHDRTLWGGACAVVLHAWHIGVASQGSTYSASVTLATEGPSTFHSILAAAMMAQLPR